MSVKIIIIINMNYKYVKGKNVEELLSLVGPSENV